MGRVETGGRTGDLGWRGRIPDGLLFGKPLDCHLDSYRVKGELTIYSPFLILRTIHWAHGRLGMVWEDRRG